MIITRTANLHVNKYCKCQKKHTHCLLRNPQAQSTIMTDDVDGDCCWNCFVHIDMKDRCPFGLCRACGGSVKRRCISCDKQQVVGDMMIYIFPTDEKKIQQRQVATANTSFKCRYCSQLAVQSRCYRCGGFVVCGSKNSYYHPIGNSWRHAECEYGDSATATCQHCSWKCKTSHQDWMNEHTSCRDCVKRLYGSCAQCGYRKLHRELALIDVNDDCSLRKCIVACVSS